MTFNEGVIAIVKFVVICYLLVLLLWYACWVWPSEHYHP